MGKTVAILQSNYIPWKGYFDMIRQVDEFIVLDTVQYTKQDWRNRNRIKTPHGLQWLTIPVQSNTGKQKIKEVKVARHNWARKHWQAIRTNYGPAPAFKKYEKQIEALYANCTSEYLSEINLYFLRALGCLFRISTPIVQAREYPDIKEKNERLLHLLKNSGADTYLSGPAARSYLDPAQFARENIRVKWMDYRNYPVYPQLYPPFRHEVSALDVLFHIGANSLSYLSTLNT